MDNTQITNFKPLSKPCELHILNGPNLDKLGQRNPEIYGCFSIKHLEEYCAEQLVKTTIKLVFEQTNFEGELIELVHQAHQNARAVIINAAGLTHTSVSLGDAVEMLEIPVFEVHLSQIYGRENFRNTSFIAPHAKGVIAGFGINGYKWAIEMAKSQIENQDI